MNANTAGVGEFRNISGRNQWVFWIFGILLIFTAIAFFSDLLEAQLLQRAIAGEIITDAEAVSNNTRQAIIGGLFIAVNLAAAVVFLMWINRAHKNLPPLGATNLRFTSGWAVGWFFVPIMSLFRPYQVVSEIMRASSPNANMVDSNSWRELPTPAIVGWWWALFLISNFIGQIGFQMVFGGEELSEWLLFLYATMSWEALDVVAGIPITILLVRRISQFQETKHRQLTYTPTTYL